MPVLLLLPGSWHDKLLETCNSITEIVRNSITVSTSLAEYRGNYVSMPLSVLIGCIGRSIDTSNPKLQFTCL